jgi:hypothetical protein
LAFGYVVYNFQHLSIEVDLVNRLMVGLLGFLLTASLCFGQTAGPATSTGIGHGAFPVKVTKTLDSSKLKEGDAIEVETAGSFKLPNGTLVPKSSKMAGHVVLAKARSKGDPESQLTIAFDKLTIGSEQLPVKGSVQAVYPPADDPQGPNMATAGTSQGGSMGGGGAGGSLSGVNPGGIGITNSKTGSDTQSASNPQSSVDPKATGVQGMHDLQLENGVLTSKGKNVKLGSGVRLVVYVDILPQQGT